jgi:hypothetical protein
MGTDQLVPCRVLRLEFETARQLRATIAVLTLALLVGMASFVALLVLRNTVVSFSCYTCCLKLPAPGALFAAYDTARMPLMLAVLVTQDDAFFFMNDALEYMNIIAAAICVSASTVVMVIFTQRSVTCLRKGMHWCAELCATLPRCMRLPGMSADRVVSVQV